MRAAHRALPSSGDGPSTPTATPRFPPRYGVCVPHPFARVVGFGRRFTVVSTDLLGMAAALGFVARPRACRRRQWGTPSVRFLTLNTEIVEDNAQRLGILGQHSPGATGGQHVAECFTIS